MKTVREVMTENPACCTPETTLEEVGQMMIDNEAMINFWSVTRRIDKSTPSQKNEPGINRPAF